MNDNIMNPGVSVVVLYNPGRGTQGENAHPQLPPIVKNQPENLSYFSVNLISGYEFLS